MLGRGASIKLESNLFVFTVWDRSNSFLFLSVHMIFVPFPSAPGEIFEALSFALLVSRIYVYPLTSQTVYLNLR
ncbi:hypothetical protein VKT23_018119 [Stygiomarasmius scandens]